MLALFFMSYTKIVLFYFFLIFLPLNIQAQNPELPWAQQLSATQVITMQGTTLTTKVNVDHGRVRSETTLEGMNMITIILPEKKLLYSIMPQQKMIMEIPLDMSAQQDPLSMDPASLKHELLGEEMRGGVLCNKYKLSTASSKPQIFWINKNTQAPVEMSVEDGTVNVQWKDVVIGPQPDSLFMIPSGYSKIAAPQKP